MSIYDSTETGVAVAPAKPATADSSSPAEKRGCGCGCGSCLVGCLGVVVILFLAVGIGGWFALQRVPDWSRTTLVKIVEDSPLPDDQKRDVVVQIDRVVTGYKEGDVSIEQLGRIFKELGKSPLFGLAIAVAADEKYVRPSGLDEKEKLEAKLTLMRVTHGVRENQIPYEDVEPALNYISTEDANGHRTFRNSVSDDDVRKMLAECKRLADDANIPPEVMEVNIADEIKAVVDRALTSEA